MPKRNKTNFTFSNMQQETVVSTKKIYKKISLEKTVQFFTRLQKKVMTQFGMVLTSILGD